MGYNYQEINPKAGEGVAVRGLQNSPLSPSLKNRVLELVPIKACSFSDRRGVIFGRKISSGYYETRPIYIGENDLVIKSKSTNSDFHGSDEDFDLSFGITAKPGVKVIKSQNQVMEKLTK